jgi:hypothetical protein
VDLDTITIEGPAFNYDTPAPAGSDGKPTEDDPNKAFLDQMKKDAADAK